MYLSGIMNGFTHVMALAGAASAVAVALMSTWLTPNSTPISVGIGLPRCAVRYTSTLTRSLRPFVFGNVTSPVVTDTLALITGVAGAVVMALDTPGAQAGRS